MASFRDMTVLRSAIIVIILWSPTTSELHCGTFSTTTLVQFYSDVVLTIEALLSKWVLAQEAVMVEKLRQMTRQ